MQGDAFLVGTEEIDNAIT